MYACIINIQVPHEELYMLFKCIFTFTLEFCKS